MDKIIKSLVVFNAAVSAVVVVKKSVEIATHFDELIMDLNSDYGMFPKLAKRINEKKEK